MADGALDMAYECIQSMRLPLVLDLDETVVKAYTASKLTKEIDELTARLAQRDPECVMSSPHQRMTACSLDCTTSPGQTKLENVSRNASYDCATGLGQIMLAKDQRMLGMHLISRCFCRDRQQMQRNIDFLKEDRELVQQFSRDGHVTIGNEVIHPRYIHDFTITRKPIDLGHTALQHVMR